VLLPVLLPLPRAPSKGDLLLNTARLKRGAAHFLLRGGASLRTPAKSMDSMLTAAPTSATCDSPVAELAQSRERFLAFLRRQTGDDALAEEILHTGFARALEREDSLRQADSAPAWFYRLLRNAVIDHYRRHGAEHRALEALSAEPQPLPERPDSRLLSDVCSCMLPLVDGLAPAYANVLRAIDVEGATPTEYAAANGLTRNNATVRLHRARQALLNQARACCGPNVGTRCSC
jgi:RNA polymerase sigma factor (sigma-70 family)